MQPVEVDAGRYNPAGGPTGKHGHLEVDHDVVVTVVDNGSASPTLPIMSRRRGDGLIGSECSPRSSSPWL